MIGLRFLGTGSVSSSKRSKNKLSRDYRRFSSLLIDDKIIIDPTDDIFEFEESFMLSGLFSEVNDVFITHSHIDHLSVCAIERLAARGGVRVFASHTLARLFDGLPSVSFYPIFPLSPVKIGDYGILPLPANHITEDRDEICFNFLIDCGKTIFYGLDGAWVHPLAFKVLSESSLDGVILDCALGTAPLSRASAYHNNLDMAIKLKELFITSSVAKENAKFILSHIPVGKKLPSHDELSAIAEENGFKLAYDGYFANIF